MNKKLKEEISFNLNGKKLTKKVSAIRIISYDEKENIISEEEIGKYKWVHEYDSEGKHTISIKIDAVSGNVLEEKDLSEKFHTRSDGINVEVYSSEDGLIFGNRHYKNDVLIYERYIEKDPTNKKIKYTREFEKGITTEIWYPFPGNKKIAEIKINENGQVITGKRTYSKHDHKYFEEFSDGTSGSAQWTVDDSKLLHLVDRTGYEQINELDEDGNFKSMSFKNWEGYDSFVEHRIDDSLSYTVSEKAGEKEEILRLTDFSSERKKIRDVIYKVI